MKKCSLPAILALLLSLSYDAFGQCDTSALQNSLYGQAFSYHYESLGGTAVQASALGSIVFAPRPSPGQPVESGQILVNVVETGNINGIVSRKSRYTTRLLLNPDCTGGEMQLGGQVFDVILAGSNNDISAFYLIKTGPDGSVLKGEAELNLFLANPNRNSSVN